ncbi:hypothetical protein AS188_04010 [Kocuria flava]|uniref:Uncharacterized protein n=1 Tax=Kocuria flava TaxID=446860 RepID=A0A0U3G278_9MICC|nr:hypothetical protein AS188_04010 [Kocuria flava]GEO90713.1 hypothetical protein KFL01_00190 [Kocuria flava]
MGRPGAAPGQAHPGTPADRREAGRRLQREGAEQAQVDDEQRLLGLPTVEVHDDEDPAHRGRGATMAMPAPADTCGRWCWCAAG